MTNKWLLKKGEKVEAVSCNTTMVWTVTVGTKGQIVIPKDAREELGIVEGDKMMVFTKHGKAIGLVKSDDLQELIGYMQQEIKDASILS